MRKLFLVFVLCLVPSSSFAFENYQQIAFLGFSKKDKSIANEKGEKEGKEVKKKVAAKKVENLYEIRLGMTFQDVKGTLTRDSDPSLNNDSGKIADGNLYSIEVLRNLGKSYDIVCFISSAEKNSKSFSPNDLTPLVFDNDRLIAKGNNFLLRLKSELEL